MIELRTLGALDLREARGEELLSAVSQPKRLGLLAYLALAPPPGFVRRDALVALFWPELNAARARRALSQALHYLRRGLGEGVLVTRSVDEVGLAPERFWCDARAFLDRLEAEDPAGALELYGGDLLESFFVSDAAPFEQWLEEERSRLRARAAAAARALGQRREADGKPAEAAAWAARAVALDPFDEGTARWLMGILDRTGSRAAALRVYQELERRLAENLQVEPSPESRAVAEAIRTRDAPMAATLQDPAPGAPAVGGSRSWTHASRCTVARPGPRRLRRRAALAIALLSLAAAIAVVLYAPEAPSGNARPPLRSIAVLPLADLGPSARREGTGTRDREAYHDYLRGHYFLNKRTPQGVRAAIRSFRAAVARDSAYARAYAGLALAYASASAYGGTPEAPRPTAALHAAGEAAARALALDSTLAAAQTALALVYHWHHWDWTAAERAYQRSLALDPLDAATHNWYALYLRDMGRLEEALSVARRAVELDPLSLIANRTLGYVLFSARRYEEAVEQYRRTMELEPGFPLVHAWLRNVHAARGDYASAFEAERRFARQQGWSPQEVRVLERAYAAGGWAGVVERIAWKAEAKSAREYVAPTVIARLHAELGRLDEAFAWLERAHRERAPDLVRIRTDPAYDVVRSDPRFEALLLRMGLTEDG